jgi:hypothetical protein
MQVLLGSCLARRQPIEAFLLLVAERAVELFEHGLDGLHPHPTALNGSRSRKALAFQF